MELIDKVSILANAAKYDVSCSSSGHERGAKAGHLGSAALPGICHSWSEDGRCVSLLKILYSNKCVYDCAYCINRASNDFARAEFTPEELVHLTMSFYKRNYIEGLFLSSAVTHSPDYTMERMTEVVRKLRVEEKYNGYIHLKAIPGTDQKILDLAGQYVDRMSINLELPSRKGLLLLAPQKDPITITEPIHYLQERISENREERRKFLTTSEFVPAGQTTQLMVGATPDTDYKIMRVAEAMYQGYSMKRVYYSAYVPVVQNNSLLPMVVNAPLTREHRLYQADWLLRFYGFKASEILTANEPDLDLDIDPKAQWALRNRQLFPVEVNRASLEVLLRVPGIGNISARRILNSRKFGPLHIEDLKALGVVMKRAKYFITCKGKAMEDIDLDRERLRLILTQGEKRLEVASQVTQLSFFDWSPEAFVPEFMRIEGKGGQSNDLALRW